MKLIFHLDTGIAGAEHVEETEIPDEYFDGCKTEQEKEEIIFREAQDWANNYIDIWWEKAKETDDNEDQ